MQRSCSTVKVIIIECCVALGLAHVSPSALDDTFVRFFHPLPGACFPAEGAVTASVSVATGFFRAWPPELQPPRWRLLLNMREMAVGVLDSGTQEDGNTSLTYMPELCTAQNKDRTTRHLSSVAVGVAS